MGANRAPVTAANEVPGRPVADGPNPDNVRRMMAEQAEREGRAPNVPPRAEVIDLIRRGKAG